MALLGLFTLFWNYFHILPTPSISFSFFTSHVFLFLAARLG